MIVAIILARGGSKGIPGKNLRPVGGVSLIGRSVRAARASALVERVYVSTDSAEIAAEALRHGARVIDRPADLSGDSASSEIGWLHAQEIIAQDCAAQGIAAPDRLVFLQCTSPFTTGADIDRCLGVMRDQGCDCALSVIADHSFLWGLDAQGRGQGMNHDHLSQRKRRQDLPPQFRENGAIYCVDAAAFARTGQRFCGPVALCEVDHPAVEIDTIADLELCSLLAMRAERAEVPLARLAQVRALVMDFDGVLTDDMVYTAQDGSEMVRASRSDGMGIGLLRAQGGVDMLILSKERNPVVAARGAKLGVEVLQAIDDKLSALDGWLAGRALGWESVLFVGNDINDAAVMARSGLGACPEDAHPSILGAADWIVPRPGGAGAVRLICEALIAARASR